MYIYEKLESDYIYIFTEWIYDIQAALAQFIKITCIILEVLKVNISIRLTIIEWSIATRIVWLYTIIATNQYFQSLLNNRHYAQESPMIRTKIQYYTIWNKENELINLSWEQRNFKRFMKDLGFET